MDYVFNTQLQQIAAIKVTAVLWNQYDVRQLMCGISVMDQINPRSQNSPYTVSLIENAEEQWLLLENRVKEMVPELQLPTLLKEKIMGLIKPVGSQILKWIINHDIAFLDVDLPQEFFWTSHGTLDKKRTAESIVKNESIDITLRYKLSCIYCLENDVQELWTKMNENCQKCFDNVNQHELVVFWTNYNKGDLAKMARIGRNRIEEIVGRRVHYLCTPYQYAFEFAASDGNAVAVKYFYDKLTITERNESLFRVAGLISFYHSDEKTKPIRLMRENYCDILFFLLTKMSHEQQMQLFEHVSCLVLKCLLNWPWQIYFLETAKGTVEFSFSKSV